MADKDGRVVGSFFTFHGEWVGGVFEVEMVEGEEM